MTSRDSAFNSHSRYPPSSFERDETSLEPQKVIHLLAERREQTHSDTHTDEQLMIAMAERDKQMRASQQKVSPLWTRGEIVCTDWTTITRPCGK